MNTQEILEKFVQKKSNFIVLPDGQTMEVRLLGVEAVTTSFKGKPVESIRYSFEINGVKKTWDRSSRELAKQMFDYKLGDVLKIKRMGKGNKTHYEITQIG